MLLSDALEVAVGLTFVFLLMSLVMTALAETLETILKRRGAALYAGVVELLDARGASGQALGDAPKQTVKALYDHSLIHTLYRGEFDQAWKKRQLPSYIPASSFALALMDQVLAGRLDAADSIASVPGTGVTTERLLLAAERIKSDRLRDAVLLAVQLGRGDIEATQKHIEAWFDSAMDRVSGWYRRRTQVLTFWIGLALSVALNVNALTIADALSENAALRRAVAEDAATYTAAARASSEDGGLRSDAETSAVDTIRSLGLPIGWSSTSVEALTRPNSGPLPPLGWLQITAGYLITALAITLGAPFWFDVLNKLIVVRATVKPHEKSPEEDSEDRQTGKGNATLIVQRKAPPVETSPVRDDADSVLDNIDPAERPREDDDSVNRAGAA